MSQNRLSPYRHDQKSRKKVNHHRLFLFGFKAAFLVCVYLKPLFCKSDKRVRENRRCLPSEIRKMFHLPLLQKYFLCFITFPFYFIAFRINYVFLLTLSILFSELYYLNPGVGGGGGGEGKGNCGFWYLTYQVQN